MSSKARVPRLAGKGILNQSALRIPGQEAIESNYMVLRAYFDESGKLADSKFVVFGGCLARESYWMCSPPNGIRSFFPSAFQAFQ